jgi:hypothetical protein
MHLATLFLVIAPNGHCNDARMQIHVDQVLVFPCSFESQIYGIVHLFVLILFYHVKPSTASQY